MPHVGGQKLKILNEYQILMSESDEKHQINAIEMSKFTNSINDRDSNHNNSNSGKSKVERIREIKVIR